MIRSRLFDGPGRIACRRSYKFLRMRKVVPFSKTFPTPLIQERNVCWTCVEFVLLDGDAYLISLLTSVWRRESERFVSFEWLVSELLQHGSRLCSRNARTKPPGERAFM